MVTAADVEAAADRLRDVLPTTPLQLSPRLSERMSGEVWLKREDLQPVRSYKVRGASQPDRAAGRASPAQPDWSAPAPATTPREWPIACAALGVTGTIFLPRTTPRQKLDRIAALGGAQVSIELSVTPTTTSAAAARRAR